MPDMSPCHIGSGNERERDSTFEFDIDSPECVLASLMAAARGRGTGHSSSSLFDGGSLFDGSGERERDWTFEFDMDSRVWLRRSTLSRRVSTIQGREGCRSSRLHPRWWVENLVEVGQLEGRTHRRGEVY